MGPVWPFTNKIDTQHCMGTRGVLHPFEASAVCSSLVINKIHNTDLLTCV